MPLGGVSFEIVILLFYIAIGLERRLEYVQVVFHSSYSNLVASYLQLCRTYVPACGTLKKFRDTNNLTKKFKSTAYRRVPHTNFGFKRELLWYTSQDDYLDLCISMA